MKTYLISMLILGCTSILAVESSPVIEATGMLYFEFDMASEAQADGVNFAKFVADSKSRPLFPAVVTGPYAAPVGYISFDPADLALEQVLGKSEANRVAHGDQPRIQIHVQAKLRNFRTEIECDSRVYRADLVSVKSLEHFQLARNGNVPSGC